MGSEGDATSHSHLRTHPPTVHSTTMAQTDGTMLDLASTLVELAPRLVSGNGNGLGQLSSLLRSNDAAVCAAASMRALATGRRAIRRQGDSGVDLRTGVSQLVELMQDSAAPSEGRVAATWALAALNESSR
jgi:type IV secretory pathway TrbL component